MSSASTVFQAVITTVCSPTAAVRALCEKLSLSDGLLIVAGDRRGPQDWDLPGSELLTLSAQKASLFALGRMLPVGHYSRKNMGYLQAICGGASCIYETDDDNAPLPTWAPREAMVPSVRRVEGPVRWVNVYRYFTDDPQIWPRGLPLEEVRGAVPEVKTVNAAVRAPVQQGLVNGSPDVDAVWRLTQDRPILFADRRAVWLGSGQWCPFNSQSTWWWPEAYPLLYIPSHCSFRMCDIWRSFVAQRCLWAMGAGIVFHAPEVVQERNAHDLMRDFEDEIPGYRNNARIATALAATELENGSGSVGANLRRCYETLVGAGFIPETELALVDAWLGDLRRMEGETR